MSHDEFTELWDSIVVAPLQEAGFRARGKTLYWRDAERCLSLIRLSGRNQIPGTVAHVCCLRHNFLRDLNGTVPEETPTEVFAYPFKFLPLQTSQVPPYSPSNLSYDKERIDYSGTETEVRPKLRRLSSLLTTDILASACALTAPVAFEQIRSHGEGAWIEGLWLEDYEKFLATNEA